MGRQGGTPMASALAGWRGTSESAVLDRVVAFARNEPRILVLYPAAGASA
jgi:hypothetical protein